MRLTALGTFLTQLLTIQAVSAAMQDITLRDIKRGIEIEARVQFPQEGTKLPLVVFSHGFGADRTSFTTIAQHWAEHGYVVVSPSHMDGFGKSKDKGAALPKGGLPALMANAVLKIENRVGDITFVLDSLDQIISQVPALKDRVDPSRVGVSGHSLGAYTTMLVGGVTADIGEVKQRSFKDARVRCILPISGQGTGQQGLTEASWATLTIPMLTMTGSLDKGAGGQGPAWKMEPYKFSPAGDKFLVFIEGANHVSFGGAKPGGITDAVKTVTLAFWNAYLKDDDSVKKTLKDGSVFALLKTVAKIEAK
jgi:predicted dienelactone hydrolase